MAVCWLAPAARAQQVSNSYVSLAADVLRYINQHRTAMGLQPLEMNGVVCTAATRHSRNMASGKIPFGHDGFDDRMAALTRQIRPSTAWAENVAFSNNDARHVVDMWLHSPGHKKNIEGHYNVTGIGIALGADGQYYFTQIFLLKGAGR